jgi:capsular exopolysaccharide synthesis family protein
MSSSPGYQLIPEGSPSPVTDTDVDIQKVGSIIKRRWIPAVGVFGGVVALTFAAALVQKPVYTASGQLLFNPDKSRLLTGLLAETDSSEFSQLTEQSSPLKTETEVLLSKPVLSRTISQVGLKDDEGNLVPPDQLKERLTVEVVPGTDVLEVSLTTDNPVEVSNILNTLMEVYIDYRSSITRSQAEAAQTFVAKQIPASEQAVSRAEMELRQFQVKNGLVDLETERSNSVQILAQLDQQLSDTQAQLADANSQASSYQSQLGLSPQQALSANALSQSPGVQSVLGELQKAEAQLALERTRFRADSPPVMELQGRVTALRSLLDQRISQVAGAGAGESALAGPIQGSGMLEAGVVGDLVKSEGTRLGLASKVASIEQARDDYRKRLNRFTALEPQLRELQRKLQAAQATYEKLLDRSQELRVAQNQEARDIRIINDAAVPENASLSTESQLLMVSGVLLGSLLAVATIFVLEAGDSSIKSVKEARDLFGYNLLGMIPSFEPQSGLKENLFGKVDSGNLPPPVFVRDNPNSPGGEAYRRLQANLDLVFADRPVKIVVLMSSVPGEGKSFVAANLAATAAESGRQVLLIDADMRRPTQHQLWNAVNDIGFSNAIIEPSQLRFAVKEIMPNLDIVTSGDRPTNAASLLQSKGTASLLRHFAKNYELIVIDAPPLNVASDALILGKLADGALFVSRLGVADPAMAVSAIESIEQSGQNVLGLVVNDVGRVGTSDRYFYDSSYYTDAAGAPA